MCDFEYIKLIGLLPIIILNGFLIRGMWSKDVEVVAYSVTIAVIELMILSVVGIIWFLS